MGSGNKSRHRNRVSVEARQECAGGALVGVAFVQCNVAYERCHKQWWQGSREGKGWRGAAEVGTRLPDSNCILSLGTRDKAKRKFIKCHTEVCESMCVCVCVCAGVCGKRSPLARVFCPLFWALARRLLPCVCFARSVNCCWHFLRKSSVTHATPSGPCTTAPSCRAWWCIAFVFVASFGLGYKCSFWL